MISLPTVICKFLVLAFYGFFRGFGGYDSKDTFSSTSDDDFFHLFVILSCLLKGNFLCLFLCWVVFFYGLVLYRNLNSYRYCFSRNLWDYLLFALNCVWICGCDSCIVCKWAVSWPCFFLLCACWAILGLSYYCGYLLYWFPIVSFLELVGFVGNWCLLATVPVHIKC